ncbi:hypothetical protein [Streptomyces flaveolus]|uniref:hypothetical protein n=1 Tax=Streptomyces flaveolus TaxID=67297 RepID=UPI0036F75800
MDAKNRFETKTTFALTRLEWLGILAVSLVLAFQHRTGIRWGVFALLFAVIDVVGYLPGAIAFRRSPDGRVPRGCYVAYNTMHSLVTAGALAGAWALFGNSPKPFGVPFEPETTPAFRTFEQRYRSASDSEGNGTPRTSVEDTDAVRA